MRAARDVLQHGLIADGGNLELVRVDEDGPILLDLQGPKIRTSRCPAPLELTSGDVLTVVMDPELEGAGGRKPRGFPSPGEAAGSHGSSSSAANFLASGRR